MARIESTTITTQTSTKIYSPTTRPEVNSPTKARIYVTGTFNGSTATLQSSPDGGITKVDEKQGGSSIAFTTNGYADIDVPSRPSKPGSEKPIEFYLTTTAANPTGIKATVFDLQ